MERPPLRRDGTGGRRWTPARVYTVAVLSALAAVTFTAGAFCLLGALNSTEVCVGCGPLNLGFGSPRFTEPQSGVYYVQIPLSPTGSIPTADFSLKLSTPIGHRILAGNSTSACLPPSGSTYSPLDPATCGVPARGWYAVLALSNETVANVFGYPGSWAGSSISVAHPDSLYLISGENLSGSYDLLDAFGVGPGVSLYSGVLL